MLEPFDCEECSGIGVDPGSLHEPEPCGVCHGSRKQLVETSPESSHFMRRKPMGRALPNPVTIELAERER